MYCAWNNAVLECAIRNFELLTLRELWLASIVILLIAVYDRHFTFDW